MQQADSFFVCGERPYHFAGLLVLRVDFFDSCSIRNGGDLFGSPTKGKGQSRQVAHQRRIGGSWFLLRLFKRPLQDSRETDAGIPN